MPLAAKPSLILLAIPGRRNIVYQQPGAESDGCWHSGNFTDDYAVNAHRPSVA